MTLDCIFFSKKELIYLISDLCIEACEEKEKFFMRQKINSDI